MATLTIRLPDDKHNRLKELAEAKGIKGISVNKLIEEVFTIVLVEFDTNTRFKAMAAISNPEEGLRILKAINYDPSLT